MGLRLKKNLNPHFLLCTYHLDHVFQLLKGLNVGDQRTDVELALGHVAQDSVKGVRACQGADELCILCNRRVEHGCDFIAVVPAYHNDAAARLDLLLLLVGTFMETNAAIIILTPILLPIVTALGINPIHFGMIMILNLAIGFITPPLGANLFMASEISRVKFETLAKTIWPWIGAMIVVLIIITYIPQISLFLPQMMGLLG